MGRGPAKPKILFATTPTKEENKVSADFAYKMVSMFQADAHTYKKWWQEAKAENEKLKKEIENLKSLNIKLLFKQSY